MFQEEDQCIKQTAVQQHTQFKSRLLQNFNHDQYQHAGSCFKINWIALHEQLINPEGIRRMTKKEIVQRRKSIPELNGYLTSSIEKVLQTGNSHLISLWILSDDKFKVDRSQVKKYKDEVDKYEKYVRNNRTKAFQQKKYIRSKLNYIIRRDVQFHFRLPEIKARQQRKKCKYYRPMKILPKKQQFQSQDHRLHQIQRTMNFLQYLRTDGQVALKIKSTKTSQEPFEFNMRVQSQIEPILKEVSQNQSRHQQNELEFIEIKSSSSVEGISDPDQIQNEHKFQLFPANSKNRRMKKYFTFGQEFEYMRSQYPELNMDDSNAHWRQILDSPFIFL